MNQPALGSSSAQVGLNEKLWMDIPVVPEVVVFLAWNPQSLFLKFVVKEDEIRALAYKDNDAVWEDSCVEFFIAPGPGKEYYNFEFNCIGTCLLAYGTGRENREFASSRVINQVRRSSSLGNKPLPMQAFQGTWELSIAIPPAALFRHSISLFRPGRIHANIYKCGDKLSNPHFLAWKPIRSAVPDFHKREDFGTLLLTEYQGR